VGIGPVEFVVLYGGLAVLLWWVTGAPSEKDRLQWARSYDLEITPVNERAVRRYLTRSQRWRRIGFLAGWVAAGPSSAQGARPVPAPLAHVDPRVLIAVVVATAVLAGTGSASVTLSDREILVAALVAMGVLAGPRRSSAPWWPAASRSPSRTCSRR
jgi:hypothetical protein